MKLLELESFMVHRIVCLKWEGVVGVTGGRFRCAFVKINVWAIWGNGGGRGGFKELCSLVIGLKSCNVS